MVAIMSNTPRFYREPSSEDVETYGSFVADARARVRAERTSSRLFSAAMALTTGISITILEAATAGLQDYKKGLGNFVIPLVVNTVSEIRAERAQKRGLEHLGSAALGIKQEADQTIARLRAENEMLAQTIVAANLPLPDKTE